MYLRGASGVVDRPREENSPLPIDDKSLPVIGYTTLGQLNTQKHPHAQKKPLGIWDSSHYLRQEERMVEDKWKRQKICEMWAVESLVVSPVSATKLQTRLHSIWILSSVFYLFLEAFTPIEEGGGKLGNRGLLRRLRCLAYEDQRKKIARMTVVCHYWSFKII